MVDVAAIAAAAAAAPAPAPTGEELFAETYPFVPDAVKGGEAAVDEVDIGDAADWPNALGSLSCESGECNIGRV